MSRSRIALRWAPALAALTLLVTRPAAAQEEETREPPSEAIEQFQAGQEHYLAGRYQEAAVALERALELDPGSPTLIFNLTRVYELMGELDKAIEFGQEYLRLVPEEDAEERANAERTLRRLEGARDWLALREAQEPPDLRRLAPRVLVRDRGVADLPFWVTLGAGAALLVGGGVVGGFALRAQNQADDSILRTEGDQSAWRDRVDRADRLALSTDILLGVGAAATLAAGLLYILRVRTYERDADQVEEGGEASASDLAVLPMSDGRGFGLALRGTL